MHQCTASCVRLQALVYLFDSGTDQTGEAGSHRATVIACLCLSRAEL